ncbi:2-amino-4-hydroxy-6-hydroxymethyldihydropteridine diphosphokinase [Sphingosinicellaceae bacterium]|nr:2-amino-4-hydroxy-6-hydroxymethyldihydropteridine diphosphokinase [Sphingosinicellaceae bacterium]
MAANLLIALGSNRRHGRHGAPAGVVAAAMLALTAAGLRVLRRSRIHATAPVGPGGRSYANAVVLADGDLPPAVVIATLKRIEAQFGRRGGRRWGDRVLDLDLLAADGVVLPSRLGWRHASAGAIVPHPRLHSRDFVLDPLVEVAPDWRHPVLTATARQLRARLQRRKRSRGSP